MTALPSKIFDLDQSRAIPSGEKLEAAGSARDHRGVAYSIFIQKGRNPSRIFASHSTSARPGAQQLS
jgi:hypothetical protein